MGEWGEGQLRTLGKPGETGERETWKHGSGRSG